MNPVLIATLVRLRLTRVFRERSNLIWLFLMPMLFSFLMGQMMGDWSGSSGADDRPRFMVYDLDGGRAADALLAPLLDNARFLLVRADSTIAEEPVRRAIDKQRITGALYIPEDFTQRVARADSVSLRLLYDSNRLSSQTARTLIDQTIVKLNTQRATLHLSQTASDLAPQPFEADRFEEAWQEPRITLAARTLGRIPDTGLKLDRSALHLGPAYTIFFVMMFLMLSAKDLVTERQDRTLARLMVSKASSLDLVLGFFIGGMVLGLLQAGVLLALNMLPPFRVDYGDSLAGLVLVVLLFAGVSSAGSVLLGTVARTGAQADGLGLAVTLIMAAMGGLWWPLEIVPDFMQTVGKILPTGQAITVFHDMIGRGYGVPELSGLLTGLAIWFVTLLALATWRLRSLVNTG
jgi:ABC-2 type transport system permease protein|nr:ABC transporter permease [Candidatus Krumholzibacteria bacterium]